MDRKHGTEGDKKKKKQRKERPDLGEKAGRTLTKEDCRVQRGLREC
jgi:hypothetical protein